MGEHKLERGDLVVLVNATYFEEWNGTIGVIETPYSMRYDVMNLTTMKRHSYMGYRVRMGDGQVVSASPEQVIPIKPGASVKSRVSRSKQSQPV